MFLSSHVYSQMLVDNFDDGDDDGWTKHSVTGQRANFDAKSGEYHFSTPVKVGVGGLGGMTSYWDDSSSPHFRDGTWRVTARANSEGSNVALMLRGDPDNGLTGYAINTTIRGAIQLRSCNSNNCQTLQSSAQGLFTLKDDWVFEAGIIADEITVKAWPEGDPIPDEPLLTYIDDVHLTGQFGLVAFIGTNWPETAYVDATFDDVFFLPAELIAGDYNYDGSLTHLDLDLQSGAINDPKPDLAKYDENLDGIVDDQDRFVLIRDHFGTWIGDSNLDGEFNSNDLVSVFLAAEFEDSVTGNSRWRTGDWNGDLEFDSSDFVVAFQNGGFEQGPLPAAIPIPESRSLASLLICLIGSVTFVRRYRS